MNMNAYMYIEFAIRICQVLYTMLHIDALYFRYTHKLRVSKFQIQLYRSSSPGLSISYISIVFFTIYNSRKTS